MQRAAILALSCALVLVLSLSAAAVCLRLSLQQMAQEADLIFVGEALDAAPQLNQAGAIETVVSLSVERTLKGAALLTDPKVVELTFAGGKLGERSMLVSGVPQLELGQRYVLLARYDGKTYLSPIVGQSQGMFLVKAEPATGRDLVLTPDNRMIAEVTQGEMRVGCRVELDEQGVFKAVLEQQPPANPEPPQSNDPENVRVLRHYPVACPMSDPAAALTLDQFIEILSALSAATPAE